MPINYNDIRLLFLVRMTNSENIAYIFLLSEDKYHYTIASYNHIKLKYNVYTINKITQEGNYEVEYFFNLNYSLNLGKILDIINKSKNIQEYSYDDPLVYKNILISHIRKIKIENITA